MTGIGGARPRWQLQAEINRLRGVCAEAYQMAGVIGAKMEVLDNLSAAAQGGPLPHETFLPFLETDSQMLREVCQTVDIKAEPVTDHHYGGVCWCGARSRRSAKFCRECGRKIVWT